MSEKIKTSTAQGINVNVTMFKNRYKVEVLIPEEVIQKEMNIKNNDFIFNFKLKSEWYGPIRIILKENYKTDEQGLINIHNYAKLEFSGTKYSGTISLSPNFYISAKKRRKIREEKKKNQELAKAFKKCAVNTGGSPKPSGSIYTNYTHNNASKPYNGGKVSPN